MVGVALEGLVQLCRGGSLSYLHGAAMADERGRGLVIVNSFPRIGPAAPSIRMRTIFSRLSLRRSWGLAVKGMSEALSYELLAHGDD